MYNLSTIDSEEEFLALESQWNELSDNAEADMPFTTFDWYKSWWRNFSDNKIMRLLVVHAENDSQDLLVAVLPLMQDDQPPARKRSIWANTHTFRVGILCHSEHMEALGEITSYLRDSGDWDGLRIPYLHSTLSVHEEFKKYLNRDKLKYISTAGMDSPWLEVKGEFQERMKALSRSRRETLNRKRRKLLNKSGGTVEITVGNVPDIEQRLEHCWEISRNTWKERIGSSIASDERRMAFYNAIAQSQREWLVLGLLYIDGKPVAFEYNLLHKGTVYNLKLGFNEDYAKLSPGIVLRLSLLEWVHENKARKFDYMGNAADYKTMFSTDIISHEDLYIFGQSLGCLTAYYTKGRLLPAVKTLLRPVKRTLTGLLNRESK